MPTTRRTLYTADQETYRKRMRTYVKAYRKYGPEHPVSDIGKIFEVEQPKPVPPKRAASRRTKNLMGEPQTTK